VVGQGDVGGETIQTIPENTNVDTAKYGRESAFLNVIIKIYK